MGPERDDSPGTRRLKAQKGKSRPQDALPSALATLPDSHSSQDPQGRRRGSFMHWGLSSPWQSALRCPPLHGVPVTAVGVIVNTEMKEPRAVPSQSSQSTGEPATCPAQANIGPTGKGLEVHRGRRDGENRRDVAAWESAKTPWPAG